MFKTLQIIIVLFAVSLVAFSLPVGEQIVHNMNAIQQNNINESFHQYNNVVVEQKDNINESFHKYNNDVVVQQDNSSATFHRNNNVVVEQKDNINETLHQYNNDVVEQQNTISATFHRNNNDVVEQQNNNNPAIQQLIKNPSLKHASVGVSVFDLATGRIVVSHDEQKALTPASVLKLITTATSIEMLGENFRYKTDVALDTDDPTRILIIGSGDPTLGSEVFNESRDRFFNDCRQMLEKSLSKDIEYSIYVVDNLFGYEGVSPEWTWIDMGNYYAAGAYGISIFDNSYRLFFNTMDKNSCPVIIKTEPEIKGLTFSNELKLNSSGADNGYIYGAPFSYDRSVRGNIPGGKTSFSIKGDIPDPGMLLGEKLSETLQNSGYKISSVKTSREDYLSSLCEQVKTPSYKVGNLLFTKLSRPLKEIIKEINVESNNHYAEHLIRTIGRQYNPDIYEDALDAGIEFVNDYWKKKGIDVASLTMFDGSGLAPQNAISPTLLTEILSYMYNKSSQSAAFTSSLPIAGQDGTLKYFMANTKYSGKIIAKSGSIGGVQCFAGYLIDGEKKYAFSIMINKFNGTRTQVRGAIEKFLQSL